MLVKKQNGYIVFKAGRNGCETITTLVFDELKFRYLISVIEYKTLTPDSQKGRSQSVNHPISRCL